MKTAKAGRPRSHHAELSTAAKVDVSEEAAREVFRLRTKPARKAAGLLSLLIATSFRKEA
jgi:hypothetical protein